MAKTFEPKEHIWYLEVDGEEKIFKCVVTETECITYLGDMEHKRLKILNPVRKNKVLQIDTITSIYGRQIEFQLENGIPYIKWDGGWKMSETNRQDRIAQNIRVNRISAGMLIAGGTLAIVLSLLGVLKSISDGKDWMFSIIGGAMIIGGLSNLSRLKMEMQALKEAEAEEAREKAERLGQNG